MARQWIYEESASARPVLQAEETGNFLIQYETHMYNGQKDRRRRPSTSHNSGYMVPLRFTQIFAPLRSAKTSYSRKRCAKGRVPRQ